MDEEEAEEGERKRMSRRRRRKEGEDEEADRANLCGEGPKQQRCGQGGGSAKRCERRQILCVDAVAKLVLLLLLYYYYTLTTKTLSKRN